jgi:hypothetical protein
MTSGIIGKARGCAESNSPVSQDLFAGGASCMGIYSSSGVQPDLLPVLCYGWDRKE